MGAMGPAAGGKDVQVDLVQTRKAVEALKKWLGKAKVNHWQAGKRGPLRPRPGLGSGCLPVVRRTGGRTCLRRTMTSFTCT